MKPRLLVVDDEPPILIAISAYFSACGYAVDCAQSRAEAEIHLNSTHSAEYAGVISDLRLAHEDDGGLQVLNLARQRHPAACRILLTAYGSPETESAARNCGVHAFLPKPQPLAALAQVLADFRELTVADDQGVEAFLRWSVQ